MTNQSGIIHGDCYELIKGIPDKSIDMIFTDPPYLTTNLDFDKIGKKSDPLYDRLVAKYADLFNQFHRVLKDNGWFFCFGTVELSAVVIVNTEFKLHFEYIWMKDGVTTFICKDKPLKRHENLYSFINNEPGTFNKETLRTPGNPNYRPKDHYINKTKINMKWKINFTGNQNKAYREGNTVLKYSNKRHMKQCEQTAHPTQKPLSLAKKIIEGYTNPGDVVFDPFSGSGTFCLAAHELGRKYIGYECNKAYYDESMARFDNLTTDMLTEVM